jgi:hypothetical protein
MNNLKKYAGLLNDIAPEGEFLAYINEKEAKMLKDNGALGLLTPQGIPSFVEYGGRDAFEGAKAGNEFGGGRNGDGGNNNYGISPGRSMAQYGTAKYAGLTETAARDRNSQDQRIAQQKIAQQKAAKAKAIAAEQDRQKRVREAEAAAKARAVAEAKRQDDARLDYITGEYLDVKLNPEQKKEFEQYRTGVREDITPSTKTSNKILSTLLNTTLFPGAGKLYNFYIDSTAMGYKVPNPFEGMFGGGDISQQMQDIQNQQRGDNNGGSDPGSQLVQNILKIATPNLPGSQVDQYFSNMNMDQGSPLSSDLQTSYDNAKSSVNNILGMTPANQQFGYSAQPYGSLSSTNMADNPFNIPYLQQRGLI